ncbi:MAG TPA: glycogen debranching N-terminal domain-containing protein [Gemmatimonadaceae bacterium]|nr:glycogen debranching N-terminal domain-containing protein [Gemmatimonadaceae bacterium]
MSPIRIRPDLLWAWHGPSSLIVDARGDCSERHPLSGFFFRETRYLRTLRLEVNGEPPWLCDSVATAPDALGATFVYPEVVAYGGGGSGASMGDLPTDTRGIRSRSLTLRLDYRVRFASLDVSVRVANDSLAPVELTVSWMIDADFADLLEASGGAPPHDVPLRTSIDAAHGGCHVQYAHADAASPYRTDLTAAGPGDWSATADRIATRLVLAARENAELTLRIRALDWEPQPEDAEIERREQALHAWRERLARVEVPPDRIAERIIQRAVGDLASFPLLEGESDEWLAMQAGMPLYPALFGRDSVTTTWQAAMIDRGDALDQVLTRLGRLQGNTEDDWRDEQPGRIIHSVRQGPLARSRRNPFARYYGDFASPLAYVIAIAQLYAWTGEKSRIVRHRDTVLRVLEWARRYGDADGDGYLEYRTRSPDGAKNQGWKDSGNGIVYEDGRIVPDPIATCELQGYWYAAQQMWAVLSWVLGEHEEAKALWRSARELKARFNRDWWIPEERCIALALDPEKRQVRSITSNAGQCLAAGIVSREHVPPLVGRLFAPDLFSGWGIRTLSTGHPAYNPVKYHLGSVWPVENATIVFGLRRFGFDQRALDLADGLFDLARLYEHERAPECVGGWPRWKNASPGTYPQANAPQAWNQSGVVLLMQTLLGLQPVAALDLLVIDPVLPAWMPEVIVRGLRLGGATATLRFRRDEDGKTHTDVLEKRGTLHVLRQPPPESLTAGIGDRFGALIEHLLPHWD